LLSRLAFPYPSPPLNLGFAAATVKPSTSAAIPNNPALEDDQIKAFLDLILTKGSSGGSSPKPPGVPRPRVRTGPFDITIALSKAAFRNIIDDFRDGFTLGSTSGGGNFGPFSLTYTATAMSLADGTVDLHNDNTVSISGLDINFGTLSVCIGIDIPQICVGGFCLVPPVGSPPLPCFVRAPTICIFGGNPTIQSCLDVGPLITAEISATLTPLTKYSVNPARTPSMNDWDADDANVQNHWQVYVDPLTIHLDLFDIADNALDLFINAVNTAIDALLAPLPGWAQDLIKSILGPVIDLVRTILGFGADFGQWLADQLAGLGIIDIILTAIADYLAKDNPLIQVADPINIVAKDPSIPLIQILIPVEFAGVHVTADELIVEADIADPT
jgi:hypothetical protein